MRACVVWSSQIQSRSEIGPDRCVSGHDEGESSRNRTSVWGGGTRLGRNAPHGPPAHRPLANCPSRHDQANESHQAQRQGNRRPCKRIEGARAPFSVLPPWPPTTRTLKRCNGGGYCVHFVEDCGLGMISIVSKRRRTAERMMHGLACQHSHSPLTCRPHIGRWWPCLSGSSDPYHITRTHTSIQGGRFHHWGVGWASGHQSD